MVRNWCLLAGESCQEKQIALKRCIALRYIIIILIYYYYYHHMLQTLTALVLGESLQTIYCNRRVLIPQIHNRLSRCEFELHEQCYLLLTTTSFLSLLLIFSLPAVHRVSLDFGKSILSGDTVTNGWRDDLATKIIIIVRSDRQHSKAQFSRECRHQTFDQVRMSCFGGLSKFELVTCPSLHS